jgi:nitrite reductase (NADH) large subunit
MPEYRLVVAGNGMAGQRLVEALRGRDGGQQWRVTALAEEQRRAYDGVNLSSYLDGATLADLDLVPEGWLLRARRVRAAPGRSGDSHRPRRPAGHTGRGRVIGCDALVLATGYYPFVPPVPGEGVPGCFVYRTLDDLVAIRTAASAAAAHSRGRRAGLVVGGGLLGLEAAGRCGWSACPVPARGGACAAADAASGGRGRRGAAPDGDRGPGRPPVAGRVGAREIARDGQRLLASLAGGAELDADAVVFAAGVRPHDRLAPDAGLAARRRGVDEGCRASDPHVYAIRECPSIGGRVYGLVAPRFAMAEVVADRLTGGCAAFTMADTSTKLKLVRVDVTWFGDALAGTEDALDVVINDPVSSSYAKLVSGDAKTLLIGVLVADASRYGMLRPLVGPSAARRPGHDDRPRRDRDGAGRATRRSAALLLLRGDQARPSRPCRTCVPRLSAGGAPPAWG